MSNPALPLPPPLPSLPPDAYRLLFESVEGYALYMVDLGGNIASWNPAAERIYGYRAEEIIGQPFTAVYPAEERASGEGEARFRAVQEQGHCEFEMIRIRKDGTRFWAAVAVSTLRDPLGKPGGYCVVTRDVTERKEAAAKVEASEARYRAIFDHAQIGLLLADNKSYYIDANASACQMLGYSRDELIGMHASDIVVPREVPHIENALRQINGRQDYRREWDFRRKDGTVFPADVVATVMPDGQLLGLVRDISEFKQVHAYREHLSAVVEASPDAILGTDLESIITSWNSGAAAMYGYSAQEIIGTSIKRLFPADRIEEEARLLERVRRGERIQQMETFRLAKDGRLLEVAVSVSPIHDSRGAIIGTSRTVRDITLLKDRERELARLTRLYAALSQVNQAIVWAPDQEVLFRKVCAALVEQGGFRMAWIGWHEEGTNRILPVASHGDENGYLQTIKVYADDRPEGRGPSGIAFRTQRPYTCNDFLKDPGTLPWRAELERRGLQSSAAFPIRVNGTVRGTLHVYAAQREFFQEKEIALVEEAAADVSFALDNFERDAARRQADQAARDEEHFADSMIESMPGILYFYDLNGRFLRWNQNFEAVSGYSGEEIARMHPLEFFQGADRERVALRIQEVFESGSSSVEAHFLSRDGTATPYFFTGRRVLFKAKPCLVGMGIDLSDRRRAEENLARSERKYRELVEYANSIILRWNAAGRVTFLNEFGQRFFGYSAEEILGRHVLETIVPATESTGRDLRRLMDHICAAPETYEQNVNECVRRDGERVWIAWTNRIVRDEAGSLVEILSIGSDITERKRAESALREAELRFHTLFEQTPAGVVVVDPDSDVIIECNEQAARQLEYPQNGLCGLNFAHVEGFGPPEEAPGRINQLLEEGRIQFETKHRTRTGKARDVFVSGRIIELAGRKLIHCVFLDITDRARAQAEREKRHRAEAADRIKSAFLATMSHELRTPLNSIIGFTGIILQELAGPLNPEQNKQLSMVRASARHLLALVNDVLDISKIEAGQLEVARQPFEVSRSISKVLGLVAPQAQAKQLELRAQVAPDLGEAVGDERRFEQILLNLLSNAIKFTDRGTIGLTADRIEDFQGEEGAPARPALRVRISDTGMGIKAEEVPSLFQPFRQIDSGLSRRHEGTGLGLAICRRLAHLMGGQIGVESQWGRGSTFSLTLPLCGAEES